MRTAFKLNYLWQAHKNGGAREMKHRRRKLFLDGFTIFRLLFVCIFKKLSQVGIFTTGGFQVEQQIFNA
jgi:hypothetical protein